MDKIFTRILLLSSFVILSFFQSEQAFAQSDGCGSLDWTITPSPVNGTYLPGQTINVCVELINFNQSGASWLHGLTLDFPESYDLSTVTNVSVPPSCSGSGNGVWGFHTSVTGDNGIEYGPGFFYDANSGGGGIDGDPGNNYGDPCSGSSFSNFEFCFDITFDPNCGGGGNPLDGENLEPSILFTGDGESGSWGGSGSPCTTDAGDDPGYEPATLNCCDSEAGLSPGTLAICENGTFNLIDTLGSPVDMGGYWTYSGSGTWSDASGLDGFGTFDPTTDPPGDYTYHAIGPGGCESTSTITMEFIDLGIVQNVADCSGTPSSLDSMTTAIPVPTGGDWYFDYGGPSEILIGNGTNNTDSIDPNTDSPGIYTYVYYDGGNCLTTFSIEVSFATGGAAGCPSTVEVCTSELNCFSPFNSLGCNPTAGGNWIVWDSTGTTLFLSYFADFDICLPMDSMMNLYATNNGYEGDLVFQYILGAPPCSPAFVEVAVEVYFPANTGENTATSVCVNDPPFLLDTILDGTPDLGYQWTDALSGDPIPSLFDPSTEQPNTARELAYTGGYPPGTTCENTTLLTLTVLPNYAFAGIDNTITVCESDPPFTMLDSLLFHPVSGDTAQIGGIWTDPNGDNNGTVFVPGFSEPGVYHYNVTSTCATDDSYLTINVIPTPVPGTSGTLDICDDETGVQLSDGLGAPFDAGGTWSPSGPTIDGNAVSDGDVFTYTVGTAPCEETSTVTINLYNAPDAGVLTSTPQEFCDSDAPIDLMSLFTTNPSDVNTLYWSGPAAWSGPTSTDAIVDPADGSSVSGTYTYEIVDANCGNASTSITITIEDTPNPGTDASLTVCPNGATINLEPELGPHDSGSWVTVPAGGPTNGSFNPANGDPAGDYIYEVSSPSGNCTAQATLTVSYETLPFPGNDTTITVCESDPAFNMIDVMTPGAVEGTWSGGTANIGEFNPAIDAAGTFTNSVPAGGCAAQTATLTIIVTPLGDAGNDATTSFCETMGNVDLTSYLNGSPDGNGQWADESDIDINNPYNITGLCGNTYTFTYTVGSASCQVSSTLTFDVVCPPNAGSDGTIEVCSDDANFSLYDGLNGTYDTPGTWSDSNGSIPESQATNMDPSAIGSGGTYTYTVDAAPCAVATADVTVNVTPALSYTNIDVSCTASQTTYIVSFDILDGQGPYSQVSGDLGTISGGIFTSAPIDVADDYSITIGDASTCGDLTVSGTAPDCNCPLAASFTTTNQTICTGSSVDLIVSLSGGVDGTYVVDYDDGSGPPDQSVSNLSDGDVLASVSPTTTTTYTLTAVTDGNCNGNVSGSVTITVEDLPDAGGDHTADYCGDGSQLNLMDVVNDNNEPTGGTFDTNPITLDPSESGTYIYTMAGNACPDDEAVYTINIDQELAIADVSALCSSNQLNYTVDIQWEGGTPPYTVTNNASGDINSNIMGTTFSETLVFANNANYSYTISDNGPCPDIVIDEVAPDCNCIASGYFTLNGSGSICLGECAEIVFHGTGDAPYDITYENANSGATTPMTVEDGEIISVCPTADNTYTLLSVSDQYCDGTVSGSPIDVTVDTPFSITNVTEICDNTAENYQVQFNINGGTPPYNFMGANGVYNTSSDPNIFLSNAIPSGNGYSITVSDAGACAAEEVSSPGHTCDCISDAGSIPATPVEACVGSNFSLSTNGSETLDANDVMQYILHDGTADAIGNIIATSPDGSFTFNYSGMEPGTTYYINAVVGNSIGGNVDLNDNCTSISNGTSVILNALPTATISGNETVCPGETVDLTIVFTGEGPWDYTYAVDGVPQSDSGFSSTENHTLNTTQPGIYTIETVSDNNCGGTGSGTATVQNYETPTATLSGNPEICEGSGMGPEVSFTGDGPWTFVYSIDGNEQDPVTSSSSTYTIEAETDGTYALVSLEGANCTGTVSGSLDITILEAPTATITGGGAVCAGDSALFEVDLTGNAPFTVQYTVDGIPQDPLTNIYNNYTFQSSIDGDYVIVDVSDVNNCSGEVLASQAALNVNPLPTADITSSSSSVCIGEEIEVGVDLEGVPPFNMTYVMNGDTITTTGLYGDFMETLEPQSPVSLEVLYVEDGSDPTCSAEPNESLYVDAHVLPNAPELANDTVCEDHGQVQIGVSSAPGLTYSWSPDDYLSDSEISNPVFSPKADGSTPTNYRYILTSSNGECSAKDTLIITVDPGPTARFSFSPDPVKDVDPTVFFENNSIANDGTAFFWVFDSLDTSTDFEPTFKFPKDVNSEYTVELTAIDPSTGCMDSYSDIIKIQPEMLVFVPNAFTPDGDGLNDLWGPVVSNIDGDDYKLTIFDRFGNTVFTTRDINKKWNGGMNGGEYYVGSGVYIWVIESKNEITLDEITLKGTVTVVR